MAACPRFVASMVPYGRTERADEKIVIVDASPLTIALCQGGMNLGPAATRIHSELPTRVQLSG